MIDFDWFKRFNSVTADDRYYRVRRMKNCCRIKNFSPKLQISAIFSKKLYNFISFVSEIEGKLFPIETNEIWESD